MSRISDLGENFEKLPDIIAEYESVLAGVEDNLKIEGKLLEHANREQAAWQSYYDERKIELSILVKYFDSQVRRVRGKLFQAYTENHSRELSDRAKDQYINKEQAYLNIYGFYLEIDELYQKFDSVVESFKARGYALNNITKIRVASLEDVTI